MSKEKPVQLRLITKRFSVFHNLLVALVIIVVCLSILIVPANGRYANRVLANGTATITISPATATITGCQTVQVQIMVNDVENLYGVDVRLNFSPALLEVVDDLPDSGINIQPVETFLTDLWIVRNEVDNGAGTIWYAATQLNPATPKSGSGVLATIHLRAKAAGISPLSFTYTKLAEINGVEIPATPTNGSVQASGAFAPILSIAKLNSSDVRLSWTGVSGAANYNLYRAVTPTSPYFTPSDPAFQVTSSLSYNDLGVLGDVNIQHYYTVKTACANGFKSESSNRVGEYDFALRNTGLYNYNDISVVFDNPGFTKASELASYIGSSVTRVIAYDAASQLTRTYFVGVSFTDFSLTTGQFLFLITDNTAPASFPQVGNIPNMGSVFFNLASGGAVKYNYISLPLDQEVSHSASAVAAEIGPSVYRILRYRTESQLYETYIPGVTFTDFVLVVGEPFILILNPGAPTRWP